MEKDEVYQKIINTLVKERDCKSLLMQIAKDAPQEILKACDKLIQNRTHPRFGDRKWYAAVCAHISSKRQILAIKHHRDETNASLRESKRVCDDIRNFMTLHDLMEEK